MKAIPAIDLYDGHVVRLLRGEFNEKTIKVYPKLPEEYALDFVNAGVKRIHLVDLNGAREGRPVNLDAIERIVKAINGKAEVEVGGGIRTLETVKTLLNLGVNFVILGTKAVTDPDFLTQALEEFKDAVIVGVDAKDGMIKISGWERDSGVNLEDFVKKLDALGVKEIIYTNTSKDGTLQGPDYTGAERLLNITKHLNVVLSGGVSSPTDLETARTLSEKNSGRLSGIIVGKAFYEGKITLEDLRKYATDS